MAREIKLACRIFLICVLIGISSYPFFAKKGIRALHLRDTYEQRNNDPLVTESKIRDYLMEDRGKMSPEFIAKMGVGDYDKTLKYYIDKMGGRNIEQAFEVFIILFVCILLGRFVFIGIRCCVRVGFFRNSQEK